MENKLACMVSANMGLGHQRAIYPLNKFSAEEIHLFGEAASTTDSEKRLFMFFRKTYECLSKTSRIPIIGNYLFNLFEKFQYISPYYPLRDQSRATLQVKALYSLIRRGLGHGICSKLASIKLPVVTSFYAAALAIEELTDLPVYCIICDADINRVWVSKNPKSSRIKYFAPCEKAAGRLRQYGVPDERIFITGFPLPEENIGGPSMHILRRDLSERLVRLDPSMKFRAIHSSQIQDYIGMDAQTKELRDSITITYAVGGAGAQTEIAAQMLEGLVPLIRTGRIRLNLAAGIRRRVYQYFTTLINKLGFYKDRRVNIIYSEDFEKYYKSFNAVLHSTDILWTKPSELSFYCGLGLPVVMAPSIGPHEVSNRRWLQGIGAGIQQEDAKYCGEWILDFLADGSMAQAAWDGFLNARKLGTYKIQEAIEKGTITEEILMQKMDLNFYMEKAN
jgi:hypothetical protein